MDGTLLLYGYSVVRRYCVGVVMDSAPITLQSGRCVLELCREWSAVEVSL
jgi:hypothetical protein